MPYLLDTGILVDVLRRHRGAIGYVASLGEWAYSLVSAMELVAGARGRTEIRDLEFFLSEFRQISLSEFIGIVGYGIMRDYHPSHGLDPADALIAATAITEELTLATTNPKHFKSIEGLRMEAGRYEA